MNEINELAKVFEDGSVIKFADGTEVKGAKGVSDVIMGCCKVYNTAYISTFVRLAATGGLVAAGAGVITYASIQAVKKIKSKRQPIELEVEETEAE